MEFTDFLTLDYIKTFVGTVVVTMLMVQFLKELPGIKKFPTRYFTFFIALFNILMCSILTKGFTLSGLYLIFINAMMITFTCTGGYDFTINKVKIKEEGPKKINPSGTTTNDMK